MFLSAFLLFMVQPLISRFILPWFGGSAAVWTTAMLFFQTVLLAGYAYSHLSISRLSPRAQLLVHAALLAVAACTLPIIPSDALKPSGSENPTLRVLALLAISVGLPYLALSATGPLLQAWFSRSYPSHSPYPLYAVSNVGSLLALVSYPFAIEPWLGRVSQAWIWSGGFLLFAALCAYVGLRVPSGPRLLKHEDAGEKPDAATWVQWIALAFFASALLLSVTNQLCIDIASVPFLWLLPLSLYLLSFIICFSGPRAYWRWPWMILMAAGIAGAIVALEEGAKLSFGLQLLAYGGALFAGCMVCHGELFRARPATSHLTAYYLAISLGGALGGLFVSVIAPLIFKTYAEIYVALMGCAIVGATAAARDLLKPWLAVLRVQFALALLCAALGACWFVEYMESDKMRKSVIAVRNFYGSLRVGEYSVGSSEHQYSLFHGVIEHGFQYRREDRKREPTSYYCEGSGVALVFTHFPRRPRRVGVVGLGTGTLAVYGRPGDTFCFYEINDAVVDIANRDFSYLRDSAAETSVTLGDARLSMEREEPQRYDILVLDAFSSDAIPVHLLTVEAMEVYRRHLREDGALCVHVSNRHLDLTPVVQAMARNTGMDVVLVDSAGDGQVRVYATEWMIVSRNRALMDSREVRNAATKLAPLPDNFRTWTDDYSNLFSVLSERKGDD